jgi:hypothetical protein
MKMKINEIMLMWWQMAIENIWDNNGFYFYLFIYFWVICCFLGIVKVCGNVDEFDSN